MGCPFPGPFSLCWSRESLRVRRAPDCRPRLALPDRRIGKAAAFLACWLALNGGEYLEDFASFRCCSFLTYLTFFFPSSSPSVSPNSLPKRPSVPSALLPRSRGKTALFPSGSASVPTTPSSTTPSADTGAVPSSASKLDVCRNFRVTCIFREYCYDSAQSEHLIVGRCESK